MITVHCPNYGCSARSQVSDEYLGKTVLCKKCRTKFVVQQDAIKVPLDKSIPVEGVLLPNGATQHGRICFEDRGGERRSFLLRPSSRRVLMALAGGAILLAGALALFFFFWRKGEEKETYGGIEVTSTEIRVFVYEFRTDPMYGFDYRCLYNSHDTEKQQGGKKQSLLKLNKHGDFDPDSLRKTAQDIASRYNKLRADFSLPPEHIVIIGGSGVLKDLKPDKVEKNKQELEHEVFKDTGQQIALLNADREVDLQIKGLIPERLRDKTVLINLASSGCRGGCFHRETGELVQLMGRGEKKGDKPKPLAGTKKLLEKVNNKVVERLGGRKPRTDKKDLEVFISVSKEVINEDFAEQLRAALEGNEQIRGRQRFEIIGGVPWVVATYANPKARDEARRKLSMQAIEGFYAEFREVKDYPDITPRLAGMDETLKGKVLADNESMQQNKHLSLGTVVVGTDMLKELGNQLRFDLPTREVCFNNHGLPAALLGLMEEKWQQARAKRGARAK